MRRTAVVHPLRVRKTAVSRSTMTSRTSAVRAEDTNAGVGAHRRLALAEVRADYGSRRAHAAACPSSARGHSHGDAVERWRQDAALPSERVTPSVDVVAGVRAKPEPWSIGSMDGVP